MQVQCVPVHHHPIGGAIKNTDGGLLDSNGVCDRLGGPPMFSAPESADFANVLSALAWSRE